MKILEICTSKGFGGLELYVLNVAKFLAETNSATTTVLVNKNSFLHKKLSENNIISRPFTSVFHHFPFFSAFKLSSYINKNKIDVMHIHWGDDLFLAVLAKALSRRNVKLIYTRQMSLTRSKDDFYHRFLYKNVDAYVVITKTLFNDAEKYLPISKDNIHLLYYGVPASSNDIEQCHKYIADSKMANNVFRIAIFGRIEQGKGQHLVIEAAKKLKEQGKEIQVAIIGHIMDDAYFNKLQITIKEDNLKNNIFYLGFHNNPTSIMSCFDAVVLATKCETFGLVLPEAMRAGVTVIGSNCGGVPEIIQHEKTGLLFESENVVDLTTQLSKIVTDKELCKKLAKAGKKDADERFSEEKHFNKLVKLFEAV
ncbi:MAG: glycosyltransferase family 4 protein [Gammaproteobacteria bacterium]|nr:glycosyltransferase family 4 protein [Gammaproteobacteria bacterium]